MQYGCYTLSLYCDHENPGHSHREFPHEFIAEMGSSCRAKARRHGWTLHKNGLASCPKCKLKGVPQEPEY